MNELIRLETRNVENEILELSVTGRSSIICAETCIRMQQSLLCDLLQEIQDFLMEEDLETYWESDIPGLGLSPCITLRFLPGAGPEAVLTELYMELNDGSDYTRHNCCFYVHTSRSQLKAFARSIAGSAPQAAGNVLQLEGLEIS